MKTLLRATLLQTVRVDSFKEVTVLLVLVLVLVQALVLVVKDQRMLLRNVILLLIEDLLNRLRP